MKLIEEQFTALERAWNALPPAEKKEILAELTDHIDTHFKAEAEVWSAIKAILDKFAP